MSLSTFERVRNNYLISSNKTFLDLAAINEALASDEVYWARALPEEALKVVISNCFCLGLYRGLDSSENDGNKQAGRRQVGFARLITDYTTFAYLTDLYVIPDEQGKGLAGWLVDCLEEVLQGMPHLRALMLLSSPGRNEEIYKKRMPGARRFETVDNVVLMRRGPAAFDG